VPKSHQRQTIVANDALLYTDRLELLPSMDRIYGDSERPMMTRIDVKAEKIYARLTGQVDSEGRSDA